MEELRIKGKQMKAINDQLTLKHDDLIRKQFHFDNYVKSTEREIKTEWDRIRFSHDEIHMALAGIQAQRDDIQAQRVALDAKARLSIETESIMIAQISSAMKPEMFAHPEITQLFTQSITNPVAMAKLKTIVDFDLNVDGAKKMIAIPDDQFNHHLGIINQCNKNSLHYGQGSSSIAIEFRCEQLSKQLHNKLKHYADLVRCLFRIDTSHKKHSNPHKPEMMFKPHIISSYYWKSDSDRGRIPPFTPQLKIFFKTPNIANNTWVQCSGPGTVLWDIDPNFHLTLGSLCDPNGKSEFTSINCRDEETDPSQLNGQTVRSLYHISFKWE